LIFSVEIISGRSGTGMGGLDLRGAASAFSAILPLIASLACFGCFGLFGVLLVASMSSLNLLSKPPWDCCLHYRTIPYLALLACVSLYGTRGHVHTRINRQGAEENILHPPFTRYITHDQKIKQR
jgi:hypothetical protein